VRVRVVHVGAAGVFSYVTGRDAVPG